MDWQIRIALIVIGIGVIGFIFYDFNRRKKAQAQKQRLIEQMRSSADQIDRLGFDVNGVGNVRKINDDLATSKLNQENIVNQEQITTTEIKQKESIQTSRSQEVAGIENQAENEIEIHTERQAETENESQIEQDEVVSSDEAFTSKSSPTEQMSLVDSFEDESAQPSDPELVFSLILKAKEGEKFKGHNFLPILLSQGLRHGDMGIFHRHLTHGKSAKVLYSVANAINPGTFDIKNIESFETPAFVFFMTVPGAPDPMMAYEAMVKTVKLLKGELGGQILDDTKSVFTEQTYHHQREVLQEHLFKLSLTR